MASVKAKSNPESEKAAKIVRKSVRIYDDSMKFFDADENQVGKVSWKDGIVCFEGNYSKAARILFDTHLKDCVDDYIKQGTK